MEDIMDNMDFNYVHILRLLYSTDEFVQLLAGELHQVFPNKGTYTIHNIKVYVIQLNYIRDTIIIVSLTI